MATNNTSVTNERPALALDVDGVLLVYNSEPPDGYRPVPGSNRYTFYNPQHAAPLHEIAGSVDIYYVTSHLYRAHKNIGRLLDLPEFGWIDFRPYRNHPRYEGGLNDDRRLALEDLLADRALAWIDDDIQPEDVAWAQSRTALGQPTLVLKPESEQGLQEHHLELVRSWLGRLSLT